MAELVAKAEAIAREAGALLREYFHRGVHTEYKGDVDLVTEADRASEKLISRAAAGGVPAHGVYGEEGTRERTGRRVSLVRRSAGRDHELRARLSGLLRGARAGAAPSRTEADQDGEMVAGVIYDPLRDEMFVRSAARGARAMEQAERRRSMSRG